jgi:hypothetical protein
LENLENLEDLRTAIHTAEIVPQLTVIIDVVFDLVDGRRGHEVACAGDYDGLGAVDCEGASTTKVRLMIIV